MRDLGAARFVLVALLSACNPSQHTTSSGSATGSAAPVAHGAHLSISCDASVQAAFDRGFVSLHNMDYARARTTFSEAAATQPTCGMLFWGLAMSYFQPLWAGKPSAAALASGTEAVAKARAAQASPREREYIAAVAAFYDDAPDYATRLQHWVAAQRQLAAHAPDDLEAQAFSAMARLSVLDKKDKTYAESIAVATLLEALLKQRPDHPGVMHYLIHAYDNPLLAPKGLELARAYAASAPEAAHAIHMPSHIYARLGVWSGVVESNIKSGDAARKRPVDGKVSRDLVHATDYLTYGYLQLGEDDKAQATMQELDPATEYELNSGPGAYGLAAAPARYALERRQWAEAAALVVKRVPYDWEHYPWAEAVSHAARGLGAARNKDANAAAVELAELERLKPLIEAMWWQQHVQIEHDVIAAWIAHDRGDDAKAEPLMRSAADRDLASGKDNVEPGHVISAIEEYGDLLIELKRPKDALTMFEKALVESPLRLNALYGAGHAAELANLPDVAKRYYTQLVASTSASSTRPARASAQAWLASHH